ncbi:MAG: DUF4293 domain-containing protein [Spirosomataceae bacterium]
MFQRIQSIFLIITAFSIAVFLGTNSFVKAISPSEKVAINAFQIYHQSGDMALKTVSVYYIAAMAVIALGLTIYTLFLYKNRVKQILFVSIISLFMGVALTTMVYHIQKDVMPLAGGEGSYTIGTWAAFISLVSNLLANRFIKRDEKLVKDADRMR